ncbi:MAG: hypothetical protein ACREU7_13640, partial [Burkholderiales bacterium]
MNRRIPPIFRRTPIALAVATLAGAAGIAAADILVSLTGEIPVNTTTSNSQDNAAVAMDADGDFVVAWVSNSQDGSGYGVFARRFNVDGTPATAEFRVNTETADDQFGPAVAMDADGDFVVAWASANQDGDGLGVRARRFDADGTPATGE